MFRVEAEEEAFDGARMTLGHSVAGRHSALSAAGAAIKRVFDLLATVVFIVLLLSLVVLVATGIVLTSPRQISHSQDRTGRRRSFRFWKSGQA